MHIYNPIFKPTDDPKDMGKDLTAAFLLIELIANRMVGANAKDNFLVNLKSMSTPANPLR